MAYDDAGNLQNSVSASLGAGPLNNLGFPTLPSYVSGSTNRLILTPASGGTTLNGIDASGVSDGFNLLLVNASTTDSIFVNHQSSGSTSTNQFTNQGASQVTVLPLQAAVLTYVVNKWLFT